MVDEQKMQPLSVANSCSVDMIHSSAGHFCIQLLNDVAPHTCGDDQKPRVSSGFHNGVNKIFALLGC
jgi:hypothetical protein